MNRKKRSYRKTRKQSGGQSQSYGFTMTPVTPGAPYTNTVEAQTQCNAAVRPGLVGTGSNSGLPMKGGRYQFTGSVTDNGLWTSGASRIDCESSRPNPLNTGTTTIPLRQSGGVAPYSGGTALQETTARYTHLPDGGAGSVGQLSDKTPFMLNVPAGARPEISQACVRTAGGAKRRRQRSSSRRSSRRSRSRKNKRTRRSRKGSRRN